MGILSNEVIVMDSKTTGRITLKAIKDAIVDCPDIVMKKVYIENQYEAFFLYVRELSNHDIVQRDFISPVSHMNLEQLSNVINIHNIPCGDLSILYGSSEVVESLMSGNTVFVFDKLPYAVSCMLLDYDKRSIDEPVTEKNVRGPHEGFIEPLNVNLSILRRRIKNNKLKFKNILLGTQAKQKVVIAYMDGIANMDIVNGLFDTVSKINVDGLSNVGQIEQLISSHPNSVFPQFLSTERPDKAMSALLEGRIVILEDGTPRVLIAPVNFFAFFQTLDDYSMLWLHGTFTRLIRLSAFLIAILLPSIYIAIISFYYYAVPLTLLIPLAESRARVPFPPIVEAMILEFTVEMVREASIRLPTYVGTAISVVAGLILGEAAVQAGIVSNLLIIIVAATAIASYVTPSQDMALAIRILRFVFMAIASIFGIIGIVVCTALTTGHLLTIESLGQPYLQPLSPLDKQGLLDSIIRAPYNMLKKRPLMSRNKNKYRGGKDEG
jgi:hypothetical protein